MIKIKKIFFLTLILLIFIERANTEISDSLFMTIGDKPITQSDLVNEIKIILILNNESYNEEKREQLHEFAIKQTLKRTNVINRTIASTDFIIKKVISFIFITDLKQAHLH